MIRLLPVAAVAFMSLAGCELDYQQCGRNDIGCPGTHGVCICTTGMCAEPDTECTSRYHYIGSRCVPTDEAASAIDSTEDEPGLCPVADGGGDARDDGGDDVRDEGGGDVRDEGGGDVRDSSPESGDYL